jgi:hypothetical protein
MILYQIDIGLKKYNTISIILFNLINLTQEIIAEFENPEYQIGESKFGILENDFSEVLDKIIPPKIDTNVLKNKVNLQLFNIFKDCERTFNNCNIYIHDEVANKYTLINADYAIFWVKEHINCLRNIVIESYITCFLFFRSETFQIRLLLVPTISQERLFNDTIQNIK